MSPRPAARDAVCLPDHSPPVPRPSATLLSSPTAQSWGLVKPSWTPLHAAASSGHVTMCEFLCLHGADMTATDGDDLTPLDVASLNAEVEVVSLLTAKRDKDRPRK